MSVTVTINTPEDEFEVTIHHVKDLNRLLKTLIDEHPTMTSFVFVATV